MRSSKKSVLSRVLPALAATALLLAGCKDSSPTEPILAAATPTPAPSSITTWAGTWSGTYQSWGADPDCDSSILYPAQAILWQKGSDVGGTLTATGDDPKGCPLNNSLTFSGTLQGSVLRGTIKFSDYSWFVNGTVSGSKLEIELKGAPGNVFGLMHLHR